MPCSEDAAKDGPSHLIEDIHDRVSGGGTAPAPAARKGQVQQVDVEDSRSHLGVAHRAGEAKQVERQAEVPPLGASPAVRPRRISVFRRFP